MWMILGVMITQVVLGSFANETSLVGMLEVGGTTCHCIALDRCGLWLVIGSFLG